MSHQENSHDEQLPPNSYSCETGILSVLLENAEEYLGTVMMALPAGPITFYDLRHQHIYSAMLALDLEDRRIDFISLSEHLRLNFSSQDRDIDWRTYLAEIMDKGSPAGLSQYLSTVADMHTLRRTITVCINAAHQAQTYTGQPSQLLDSVEHQIEGLRGSSDSEHYVSASRAVTDFSEDLNQRMLTQGVPSGIVTGFVDLDYLTDGLQLGEQFVIGARPSIGKTAIGLNIFMKACLVDRVPALFISLEQSYTAIMRRLAAAWCEINMRILKRGNLETDHLNALQQFNLHYRSCPATIYDYVSGGASAPLIASLVKRAAKRGVKLVVIDYLQKIRPATKHEKRTYEVGEVSGILRAAAVSSKVAMVTLAQLNRENEKDKKTRRPRLADLADSGQIERDADVVGLLHRDRDAANGSADLQIAKQRDGETGLVRLYFSGAYCRFYNGSDE